MLAEEQKWPYDFPLSADFPHPNQRGFVRGRLMVHDKYIDSKPMAAKSAYIVLAPPGDVGSWQDNFKVASSIRTLINNFLIERKVLFLLLFEVVWIEFLVRAINFGHKPVKTEASR